MKNLLKFGSLAVVFQLLLNSCGCLLTIVEVDLQNYPFIVHDIIENNEDISANGYYYRTKAYKKEVEEILGENEEYCIYVNHSMMQNTSSNLEHKGVISGKGLYQIGDTITLTKKVVHANRKNNPIETSNITEEKKRKILLTLVELDSPQPFVVNRIKNNADDVVKKMNRKRGYNIPKYIFQSSRYRREILNILDNEVGLDYEYSLYLNTSIKSKRLPAEHKAILAPKGLYQVGDTISLVNLKKNQ